VQRCNLSRSAIMNSMHLGALRALAITTVLLAGATTGFGQNQSGPGFLNGLFGGNDSASSNREQPAQGPGSDLVLRVDRLEAQVRQLTGVIEQLQFRNQQLTEQLQRLQANGDSGAQLAGQAGVPPPATVARPPVAAAASARRGDAFDPSQNPGAPGAPRVLGSLPSNGAGPGISESAREEPTAGAPAARVPGQPLRLGAADAVTPGEVVPGEGAPAGRPPGASGTQYATLPPSDSPKDNFDLAYGYLQHKDYALAEDSFRAFLRKFPSDRLAPDAEFWLGESMFQRQRYRDAAEAFLNVSTKYESTAKGPDALLRLGQSLAALGEKEAACASLGEVLRKYPRAALSVKQGVEREQKRAGC
jgi:tol-pal system protein YbgF